MNIMQEKWRRRIRWFFENFTPGFTMYSKYGAEVYYKHGILTLRRDNDWKRILDEELEHRAQLEAFWAAERAAAGEMKPKDRG